MSAAFEAVQAMYGLGVAERLEEEGLLVRDHVAPKLNKAGVVMDVPSHWNLVIDLDPNQNLGWQDIPYSMDNQIKDWFHGVRVNRDEPHFEKAYPDAKYGTAKRWHTMVSKVAGVTAKLVPCILVSIE